MRTASPFSASPSSTVSGGPSSGARACSSPARRRWAVFATASTGRLTWRPTCAATTDRQSREDEAEADDAGPGQRDAFRQLFGGHRCPRHGNAAVDEDRHVHLAARGVADGERLAVPCPQVGLVVGSVRPGGAEDGAVREHDAGQGCRVGEGGLQEAGQLRVVVQAGHDHGDGVGLLARHGHAAVCRQRLHQQQQGNHEGSDDRRAHDSDEDADLSAHLSARSLGRPGGRRPPAPSAGSAARQRSRRACDAAS